MFDASIFQVGRVKQPRSKQNCWEGKALMCPKLLIVLDVIVLYSRNAIPFQQFSLYKNIWFMCAEQLKTHDNDNSILCSKSPNGKTFFVSWQKYFSAFILDQISAIKAICHLFVIHYTKKSSLVNISFKSDCVDEPYNWWWWVIVVAVSIGC